MADRCAEDDPARAGRTDAVPGGADGLPHADRSALLDLALFALRATRTREELLEEAARITAAALGGHPDTLPERPPPAAADSLVTLGAGWPPGDAAAGALRVTGGTDASPGGHAEAAGTAQASFSEAEAEDPAARVPRADSRRADASGPGEAELLLRVAEVLGAALAAEDRRRAALEAAAAVQALLSAEAEHRIANSLQAVAGSLALQARLAAGEEPRVAAPLRAAAARVAAAGAVHRYLHRVVAAGQGQGGSVDAAALLRTLCADLSALLSGPTGAEGRQVACEVEPIPWPAARAGALATIAAELAINGAKHAPAGMITLRLSPAAGAGGDALLVAEDEGPGFPVGLDLSRASGLGMRLIRTLAGSREGRVSIDRAARGGRIVVRVAASG